MNPNRTHTAKWLWKHEFSRELINAIGHWTYEELLEVITPHGRVCHLDRTIITHIELQRLYYRLWLISNDPSDYYDHHVIESLIHSSHPTHTTHTTHTTQTPPTIDPPGSTNADIGTAGNPIVVHDHSDEFDSGYNMTAFDTPPFTPWVNTPVNWGTPDTPDTPDTSGDSTQLGWGPNTMAPEATTFNWGASDIPAPPGQFGWSTPSTTDPVTSPFNWGGVGASGGTHHFNQEGTPTMWGTHGTDFNEELENQSSSTSESDMSTTEILTCFYKMYNPEKVVAIPAIVKQFTGCEEKLYSSLHKKYGVDPRLVHYMKSPSSDTSESETSDSYVSNSDTKSSMVGEAADIKIEGTHKEITDLLRSYVDLKCRLDNDDEVDVFFKNPNGDEQLLFHVYGSDIVTPIKSNCAESVWIRHVILHEVHDKWGFTKYGRSKYRLMYNCKGSTFNSINKIVDFLCP